MIFVMLTKLSKTLNTLVSVVFKACHHAIDFQLEIKKKKASLSEMGSQIKKPLALQITPRQGKERRYLMA